MLTVKTQVSVKAADGQHVTNNMCRDLLQKSITTPLISILLGHVTPEVKIILCTALITSEFSAKRNSCWMLSEWISAFLLRPNRKACWWMWGDNLVMEVPCLKVSVCAFPPKQGAVVNLYQLPVGVVTKVPEESMRTEVLKYNMMCLLFFFFYIVYSC